MKAALSRSAGYKLKLSSPACGGWLNSQDTQVPLSVCWSTMSSADPGGEKGRCELQGRTVNTGVKIDT